MGYTNGLGFRDYGSETDPDVTYGEDSNAGRHDLTAVDTTMSGFHQEALVPKTSETHSGEDISLHAKGPGAQLAAGTVEQNYIFHLINQALGLVE